VGVRVERAEFEQRVAVGAAIGASSDDVPARV